MPPVVTAWPTVTVLLAVAPLVTCLLIYGPGTPWGTVSSALSQSGSVVPPFVCVLGFAASNLVHLALSGRAFPLIVLPAFAAAILSTFTGEGVNDECDTQCALHALALWVLVAFETYALLAHVRVSGWLVWPGLLAFFVYAVVYRVIVDDPDFDNTRPSSLYLLRSAGVIQVLSFLAARMLTAQTLHNSTTHVVFWNS